MNRQARVKIRKRVETPLKALELLSTKKKEEYTKKFNNPVIDSTPRGKNAQVDTAGKAIPFTDEGRTAVRGTFPWHAGIIMDKTLFCEGALIHQQWVLTADQCTDRYMKTDTNFEIKS